MQKKVGGYLDESLTGRLNPCVSFIQLISCLYEQWPAPPQAFLGRILFIRWNLKICTHAIWLATKRLYDRIITGAKRCFAVSVPQVITVFCHRPFVNYVANSDPKKLLMLYTVVMIQANASRKQFMKLQTWVTFVESLPFLIYFVFWRLFHLV